MKLQSVFGNAVGLWSIVLGSLAAADDPAGPVVDLGYVKLQGSRNESIGLNAFRGIKYAQAPVGDLRWRAPRPIEDKNDYDGDLIDATKPGKICGQAATPYNSDSQSTPGDNWSEDCLLLDVIVPENPKSDKLPVLLEIHGGGFIGGSIGNQGIGLMSRADNNMIFVEIQYRLGMFGFLAGDEIWEDGDFNVGVKDQRLAIEWVRRHIAKFGGDPDKITIWGGSAGGCSVNIQQTAYGGKGKAPFRAAIPEYPGWHSTLNTTTQNTQFQNVLNEAGCEDLKCLRSKTSEELFKVNGDAMVSGYTSPGYNYGLFYYNPVIDGDFIPEMLSDAFRKGHYHKTPMLTSHTTYEGYIFTDPKLKTEKEETEDAVILFQGGSVAGNELPLIHEIYDYYPRYKFNSTFFQREQWYGDLIYACPTHEIAKSMVHHGHNSSAVFKLLFFAGSQTHGASGTFLNSATPEYTAANNQTIVDFMTSYWISFVQTLDPNPLRHDDAPFWQSYEVQDDEKYSAMKITYTTAGNTPDIDQSPRCSFWARNAAALPQ